MCRRVELRAEHDDERGELLRVRVRVGFGFGVRVGFGFGVRVRVRNGVRAGVRGGVRDGVTCASVSRSTSAGSAMRSREADGLCT